MPDRTPRHNLTRQQAQQLRILLAARALDRETSVNVFSRGCELLNATALANLFVKGFSLSAVRTPRGGSRCTHYWLTEGGAAMARQILQGDV